MLKYQKHFYTFAIIGALAFLSGGCSTFTAQVSGPTGPCNVAGNPGAVTIACQNGCSIAAVVGGPGQAAGCSSSAPVSSFSSIPNVVASSPPQSGACYNQPGDIEVQVGPGCSPSPGCASSYARTALDLKARRQTACVVGGPSPSSSAGAPTTINISGTYVQTVNGTSGIVINDHVACLESVVQTPGGTSYTGSYDNDAADGGGCGHGSITNGVVNGTQISYSWADYLGFSGVGNGTVTNQTPGSITISGTETCTSGCSGPETWQFTMTEKQ